MLRSRAASGLVIAAAICASTIVGTGTGSGATPGIHPGSAPAALPERIDLRVVAGADSSELKIRADVAFRVQKPGVAAVPFGLPDRMHIDAIRTDRGETPPFSHSRGRAMVALPSPREAAGRLHRWTFEYTWPLEHPLREVTGLRTLSPWYPHVGSPDGDGFPRFAPTVGNLEVLVPEGFAAASNGVLEVTDRGRRYLWRQERPTSFRPLVLGRFQRFDLDAGGLRLYGFFRGERAERATRLLEHAGRAMAYFSEVLGPYPGSTYTMVEHPMPRGSEAFTPPGLTILSSRNVDDSETFPYRVVAHEVAHNWWSHALDFTEPEDLWLREGLPTYSALLFLESAYGEEMLRRELINSGRIARIPERPEPLARGARMRSEANRYCLNYHKAARVLHMLRTMTGRERFLDILRELYRRRRGDVADRRDFFRIAAEHHDASLDDFVSTWVESAELPSLTVRYGVRSLGRPDTPLLERFGTSGSGPRLPIPESAGAAPKSYRVTGEILQEGIEVEVPVIVRIRFEHATSMDRRVMLKPGTTKFSIYCPAKPVAIQVDPGHDLLHDGIRLEPEDERLADFREGR